MDITEVIGLLAGFLTTIPFIPQVIKTWRSRSAKDLSLGMFLLFWSGILLWLIYGVIIENTPIIIANGFTLALASIILIFKFRFNG